MKFFSRIFIFSIFFFSAANFAFAAVVINEVQIAPIDGRFIELYNTGGSDVDLTGWYIQRKTATGSSFGSFITSTDFENKKIKANGYFLISHSQLANSNIVKNLTLTESNILRLRDAKGTDIDQVEWGSVSEGNSYQRTLPSGWVIGSPTPGAPNVSTSATSANASQQETSATSTGSTSTTNTGSSSSFPVEPQIFASAGDKKRTAVVGGTSTFSGRVWGLKKEPIENARMLWNFGDGSTAEGKTVAHTYRYPGTYIVTLDTSSGYYSASDRVTVEAVSVDVIISSIGDSQSSFVELYNKSKYELDLSFWNIRAGNFTFIIPEHTLAAAGVKIKFASEVTGLPAAPGTAQAGVTSSASAHVALYYPNGILAHLYSPT
ncbi:MAG: lamin tail domain-containing protein, partial [Candidatus Yonathbacteria bacterium]|nr:lamin tail domain-containing protein [Candidatus Yonathbacteria bacterium]